MSGANEVVVKLAQPSKDKEQQMSASPGVRPLSTSAVRPLTTSGGGSAVQQKEGEQQTQRSASPGKPAAVVQQQQRDTTGDASPVHTALRQSSSSAVEDEPQHQLDEDGDASWSGYFTVV